MDGKPGRRRGGGNNPLGTLERKDNDACKTFLDHEICWIMIRRRRGEQSPLKKKTYSKWKG